MLEQELLASEESQELGKDLVECEVEPINLEVGEIEEAELCESKEKSELEQLKEECERMRAELSLRDEQDRARARMDAEFALFSEYFPEVKASEIPQQVFESVKNGSSLSGAYALYLRRAELEKRKIADCNEKNRKMSSGTVVAGEGERYFSPSEVKKMTPAQVKINYDDIVRSMRYWN